jgi:dipeptidyl aminopeptidase/acylaminoacyl peptidase
MPMSRSLSDKQVVLAVIAAVGLLVVLCLGLLVALLIVGLGDGGQLAKRSADGNTVDRIALLSTDGNLYLVDRAGEHVEELALAGEGTVLAHPTWSPDGKQVAFVARRETGAGVESILYNASTSGDTSTELYASADNPAFYLYWSPDSQYVSFLTQEDSSLALRLAPADGSQTPRVLERGAPFYWSWSPDASEILMHIGGPRRLSDEARLAILAGRPEASPDVLDDAPANFQAPAWSPDGEQLLYAGEDENGRQALYVRERESGVVDKLVEVPGLLRFNWSPDGQWIAYQRIDDPRVAPLGHVFLANVATLDGETQVRRVTRDAAVAFFWSPDSQHLAILVPSIDEEEPAARAAGLAAPFLQEPRVVLRWWLVDMPDGEPYPLVAFRPTRSFLLIIPYFDQYAQSIRFWSPDSRYLVYSDQEAPQQSGIWLADVLGEEPPRRLADGILAVWSWK